MKWYLTLVACTLLNFASFKQINTQPTLTISTSSSSTPCYGDVVTLVCHHPELATNKTKYFSSPTAWRQDDMGITPSTGVYGQADTSEDFMSTTLTINITVDHFRNKSFYYSCILLLAGTNGLPSGDVETSGRVTIDPLEPLAPEIASIDCSQNGIIALCWSHKLRQCYNDSIRYNVSWVNIDDNTTDDSETISKNYTIHLPGGAPPNSNYTITVQAQVQNVASSPASQNVTTGQPQATCYNCEVCYNRNFTLYCEISPMHFGQYSTIYWTFNSRNINGYTTFNTSSDGRELFIRNVTAGTIGDYGCSIVLNDKTFMKGMTCNMKAFDFPKKPTVSTDIPPGENFVNVSWQHEDSCFEDHTFHFKVTWYSTTSGNSSQMTETVNEASYLIHDLIFFTEYTICVSAVSTSSQSVQSDRSCTIIILACKTPAPTTALASLLVIPVLLIIAVLAVVGVACLWRKRSKIGEDEMGMTCLWRKRSKSGDCEDEMQLPLFQVTDAMNRNGVKILSVQGQCVSSDCDPCTCEGEPSAVNVFGTFKEKTLVLSFIKGEGEDRKKYLHDFDLQRTRLSADYCFVVWVGRSVPGKFRSEVQRNMNIVDCEVLPVSGFPWKVGSPEERQFVQSLYLSQVEIEKTNQLAIAIKKDNEEVAVAIDENHEVSITAPEPYPDAPPVDIHRMIKHILLSPQLGEGTNSSDKPSIPSMYASPYAPLESLEVGRSLLEPSSIVSSTAPLISNQSDAKRSRVHRRTKESLVNGVASVLEILHVTILSVGVQCRRAECQDGGNCTHVNTFQPDIAGVFGETSFVIRCVLYPHDRTNMPDQLKTLNDVRKGMGLSLGLLVYDQTYGTPQVPSQQIPPNCLLVPVGAFKWDCQWVRSTLLALYGGLCTPLTAETSPPTQEGIVYTEVNIGKDHPCKPPALEVNVVYSDIADIGEEAAEEAQNRPPPLPQKREVPPGPPDPRDIQFQSDVIEVLEEIGVTVDEKEQSWFKGTYKSLEFLAACRGEPDHDLKTTDVDCVLGIKTKMAVTRAVFICNSDTIPMNSLLKLDEAKCGFVKAFGHGSEKWKGRLIQSIEDTVEEWLPHNIIKPMQTHTEKKTPAASDDLRYI